MAEIFSTLNQPAFGALISFVGINRTYDASNWELKGQTYSADGLTATADYVLKHGDPQYPVTANVRINVDPEKAGVPQKVHFSIRLNGWTRHVEDSTTPDTVLGTYAHDSLIAWNVPRAVLKDANGMVTNMLHQVFWLAMQATPQPDPESASLLESDVLPGLAFLIPTIL